MRYSYELYPGQYFLEIRRVLSWEALSRDNDYEVMKTRYDYQAELMKPGSAVRLLDWKGKVLMEKTGP